MVTTAYVNIWRKRVGAVAWHPDEGIASFQFDPRFSDEGWDIAPFTMPVADGGTQIFRFPEFKNNPAFKGLPGMLADALPDKYGNAVIDAWLAGRGRPAGSLNPVETLCFIGTRGMGALEFEPARPKYTAQPTRLEVGALVDMAEKILSRRKRFRTSLPEDDKAMLDILRIGSSAGGARAKALVAFNTSTGEIRSGQAEAPEGFTHWILKFDGVSDTQFGASHGYGRVELAYYHMALDCGIDMNESTLYEENGRAHFLTRRFDRTPANGKFHMQSLCGLRHFDFNAVGTHSYEQVFETMRLMGLPYPQMKELFRRMVFNVVGRNCDDHTKNFSFLMDQSGNWRLSPAYDMCHAYRPGSAWVSQHGLTVNGKRTGIKKEDLLAVARHANIKKPEQLITQTTSVFRKWQQYAEKAGVEKKLREAIRSTLLTRI